MKMIVVSTITSTLDVETMQSTHALDINDSDGVSEVSSDVLAAVVMGGLNASIKAVEAQWPRVAAANERARQSNTEEGL